jgi:hypothetical protein
MAEEQQLTDVYGAVWVRSADTDGSVYYTNEAGEASWDAPQLPFGGWTQVSDTRECRPHFGRPPPRRTVRAPPSRRQLVRF